MHLVKELKGFSGCRVLLCSDGGKHFVRKIAANEQYSDRLRKQMDKQMDGSRLMRVPSIFNHGMEDSLFFYDMDYIKGMSLIQYCSDHASVHDVISTIKGVVSTISNLPELNGQAPAASFQEAIRIKTLGLLDQKGICPDVRSAILECIERCEGVKIAPTFCHGDCTLENIILDEGEVYYIDLLDSFYSHYWMDYAKIYQDLEGSWFSIRNPKLGALQERMVVIKERLDTIIRSTDPGYFRVHYLLLTLAFMRILPYATEHGTRMEVLKRVNQLGQMV